MGFTDEELELLDNMNQTRMMAKILLEKIFSSEASRMDIEGSVNGIFRRLGSGEKKLFNKFVFDQIFQIISTYVSPLLMTYREVEDKFGHYPDVEE